MKTTKAELERAIAESNRALALKIQRKRARAAELEFERIYASSHLAMLRSLIQIRENRIVELEYKLKVSDLACDTLARRSAIAERNAERVTKDFEARTPKSLIEAITNYLKTKRR